MISRVLYVALTGSKIACVFCAAFLVNNIGLIFFAAGAEFAEKYKETDILSYVLTVSLGSIAGVIFAWWLFFMLKRYSLKLHYHYAQSRPVVSGTVYRWFIIALLIVASALSALLLAADARVDWTLSNWKQGIALMALVAFFPAVVEELAYRWIVYDYAKRYMPRFWAAFTSGALFGAIHLDQVGTILGASLLLLAAMSVTFLFVSLYEWAGSICAAIIMHWVWNMFFLHIGVAITSNFARSGAAESMFGDVAFTQFVRIHLVFNNNLLSGGEFGVDASPITILIYSAFAVVFWKLSKCEIEGKRD